MPFFILIPGLIAVAEIVETVAVVGAVATTAAVATYATREAGREVGRIIDDWGESSSSSRPRGCGSPPLKTIWDWWGNGLTSEEYYKLEELGYDLRTECFPLEELKNYVLLKKEKEPGIPTKEDGYEPPKNWDGKKVKVGNSQKKGYPHKNGDIWVPTGRDPSNPNSHGGPHWDVQDSNGGNHRNVKPKKK
ncbi:hypothetical protein C1645_735646 [Glomus cerebriforme]|uniref:Toxin 37-like C-terminal domain-containing protein n=1 Tax=Glomus cerebriforme TaxID=658196 RepID=A0A397T501_9GLOM|nr:hypothetical protein C1645_735646 [Glomus cerebriforme]